MAKRITSILFIVGLMLLFNTLYETPGLFIGLALSIIEIKPFLLLHDRSNFFRIIDPFDGKSISSDAVVSEKIFPKVCGFPDDFAANFVLVATDQE